MAVGKGEPAGPVQPDRERVRAVTVVPGRRLPLAVVGLFLIVVPSIRIVEWWLGHDLVGRPVATPWVANAALIVAGLYLVRLQFRSHLTHEYMKRFAARVDPEEPLRRIEVVPAWAGRRHGPRLGLDLGNGTVWFGWVALGPVTDRFDPTAVFGLSGRIGVRRGAVLVSPATRQLVISARPMVRIPPGRRPHPLAEPAERTLGWSGASGPPPVAASETRSGPAQVIDLPPEGHLDVGVVAAPQRPAAPFARASAARFARALRPTVGAFAASLVVLVWCPASALGSAVAALIVASWIGGTACLTRWGLQPLSDHVARTEELPPRDARTVASMVLRGGLGRPDPKR